LVATIKCLARAIESSIQAPQAHRASSLKSIRIASHEIAHPLIVIGNQLRYIKDLETVVERSQQIWEQYQTSQNDQFLDGVALNNFMTAME